MEKFLNIIQKSHLLIGFDFEGRFRNNNQISKFLTFIKYSNLIILITGFLQMLTYITSADSSDSLFMDTTLQLILSFHGIFKVISELLYFDGIKKFLSRIDEVYKTNLRGYSTENGNKLMDKMAKFTLAFYFASNMMPVLEFSSGLISYLLSHPEDMRTKPIFQFGCYFPFDKYNYLPWTLIYMLIIHLRILNTLTVFDQIAVFKTLYLANCFERLADDLKEVIDGSNNRKLSETKKMLGNIVDVHNKLIAFCAELNEFYKYVLLLFGSGDAFIVAVVAYMSVVS